AAKFFQRASAAIVERTCPANNCDGGLGVSVFSPIGRRKSGQGSRTAEAGPRPWGDEGVRARLTAPWLRRRFWRRVACRRRGRRSWSWARWRGRRTGRRLGTGAAGGRFLVLARRTWRPLRVGRPLRGRRAGCVVRW